MTNQQEYKHDPKTKSERGDATINWRGEKYTSRSVVFNTATRGGLVFASNFQLSTTKNPKDRADDSSFVACFLNNADIPETFEQAYTAGETDHPFRWDIYYDGIKYSPTRGTITGKFFNGYRKIEAEIRMFFEDNTSAIILFNAEKV